MFYNNTAPYTLYSYLTSGLCDVSLPKLFTARHTLRPGARQRGQTTSQPICLDAPLAIAFSVSYRIACADATISATTDDMGLCVLRLSDAGSPRSH